MLSRATWPLVLALTAPARAAVQPMPMRGTEVLVAGGPGNQTEPAIAYPYVAYADIGTGTSRAWYFDANGKDGATTCKNNGPGTCKAVGGEVGSQAFPALFAGVIAFAQGDGAAARIVRYEIMTGQASPVADSPWPQGNPCVSQRVVAWEDGPFGATTIWVKDVRGDVENGMPFAIGGSRFQVKPRCSGPLVAYVDVAQDGSVWVFDLDKRATGATGDIVKVHGGPAASADVDQGVVALSFSSPADQGDIAVVSTSGAPLNDLRLSGLQANPHVSGDWVAFEDWSTGTSRVILWKWNSTREELYVPSSGSSSQQLNDLDWPRVVYADNRNGDYDVFMFETAFDPPPPPDGGVSCGDANATVLADLLVDRVTDKPHARNVDFRVPRETRVLVCIDPDRVSSAWVLLDDEAIATPRDFNPNVTHLERRREVEEGTNRLGAVIAGKPGASIRVRVLLDPRGKDREEHEDDGDGLDRGGGEGDGEHKTDERARRAREAKERSRQELGSAAEVPPGPPQGCGPTGAGLLGVPALAWLGRRRRGGPARPS